MIVAKTKMDEIPKACAYCKMYRNLRCVINNRLNGLMFSMYGRPKWCPLEDLSKSNLKGTFSLRSNGSGKTFYLFKQSNISLGILKCGKFYTLENSESREYSSSELRELADLIDRTFEE